MSIIRPSIHRLALVVALCCAGLVGSPLQAEVFDLDAAAQQRGVLGYYYANAALDGVPLQVRVDAAIDFDWGEGAPAGLDGTAFGVRWVGVVTPAQGGELQLFARCDDRIRVFLDDRLVIDDWRTTSTRTVASPTLAIEAGTSYRLVVEYGHTGSSAGIALGWRDPPSGREVVPATALGSPSAAAVAAAFAQAAPAGDGPVGGYFANRHLEAPAALLRRDATIAFDWRGGSPDAGVPADDFSVRWVGSLTAPDDDRYQLIARTDDGVRVWLDGELVIDHWKARSAADSFSRAIDLVAGEAHELLVEYYERGGRAVARLDWRRAPDDERLLQTAELVPRRHAIPAGSPTSPAYIEGTLLGDLDTGLRVDDEGFYAQPLGGAAWYANVPLDPFAATQVDVFSIVDEQHVAVTWIPTVLDGGDEVVVRSGDSLLVDAPAGGLVQLQTGSGFGGPPKSVPPDGLVVWEFADHGYFTLVAQDAAGQPAGSRDIVVVATDLAEETIACEVGYARLRTVAVEPAGDYVTVGAADARDLQVETLSIDDQEVRTSIRVLRRGTPVVTARVGGRHGPLLATREVDEFKLHLLARKEISPHFETGIAETGLYIEPYIPDLWLRLRLFAGSSTFEGGRRSIAINTSGLTDVPDGWPALGLGAVEQVVQDSGETWAWFPYRVQVDGKACHRVMVAQVNSPAEQVSEDKPANPKVCPHGCEVAAAAEAGCPSTIAVTVENTGDCEECYTVTATSADGKGTMSGPEEICLAPHTSGSVELTYTAAAEDPATITADISVVGDRGSECDTSVAVPLGASECDLSHSPDAFGLCPPHDLTPSDCLSETVSYTITNDGDCGDCFDWEVEDGLAFVSADPDSGTVCLGPGESTVVTVTYTSLEDFGPDEQTATFVVESARGGSPCEAETVIQRKRPDCELTGDEVELCPGHPDVAAVDLLGSGHELVATLTNTGECGDHFDWWIEGDHEGIVITRRDGSVDLAPGDSEELEFDVEVAAGLAGRYEFQLIAESERDGGECEATLIVVVPEPRCGVEPFVQEVGDFCPGGPDEHREREATVTITNNGDCDDSFRMQVQKVPGFDVDPRRRTTRVLSPGESQDITLSIEVTDPLLAGGSVAIPVIVESTRGSATCLATINATVVPSPTATVAVDLAGGPVPGGARVGGTTTISHGTPCIEPMRVTSTIIAGRGRVTKGPNGVYLVPPGGLTRPLEVRAIEGDAQNAVTVRIEAVPLRRGGAKGLGFGVVSVTPPPDIPPDQRPVCDPEPRCLVVDAQQTDDHVCLGTSVRITWGVECTDGALRYPDGRRVPVSASGGSELIIRPEEHVIVGEDGWYGFARPGTYEFEVVAGGGGVVDPDSGNEVCRTQEDSHTFTVEVAEIGLSWDTGGDTATLCLNDDDDDQDGTEDLLQAGGVAGEDDLRAVTIDVPFQDGEVTLSGRLYRYANRPPQANVHLAQIYLDRAKTQPLELPATWPAGSQPDTVYVEGRAVSEYAGEVSLQLTYRDTPFGACIKGIGATVVDVDLTANGAKQAILATNSDHDEGKAAADRVDESLIDDDERLIVIDDLIRLQLSVGVPWRDGARDDWLAQADVVVEQVDGKGVVRLHAVRNDAQRQDLPPEERWQMVDVGTDLVDGFIRPDADGELGDRPGSWSLYAEGVAVGTAVLEIRLSHPEGECSDRLVLVVDDPLDLDVDSDNDDGIEEPKRTLEEDLREDDRERLPKLVVINDGYTDADAVPDFADGYDQVDDGFKHAEEEASRRFVPVVIAIGEELVPEELALSIRYPASDPNEVYRSGDEEQGFTYHLPNSGSLRLWTKDGAEARDGAQVATIAGRTGGDYLAPDIYDAEVLGFSADQRVITVFVEAVKRYPALLTGGITVDLYDRESRRRLWADEVLLEPITVTVDPVAVDQGRVVWNQQWLRIESNYLSRPVGPEVEKESIVDGWTMDWPLRDRVLPLENPPAEVGDDDPEWQELATDGGDYEVPEGLTLSLLGGDFPGLDGLDQVDEVVYGYRIDAPSLEGQIDEQGLTGSVTLRSAVAILAVEPRGSWQGAAWDGDVAPAPYGGRGILGVTGVVSFDRDWNDTQRWSVRTKTPSSPIVRLLDERDGTSGPTRLRVAGLATGRELLEVVAQLDAGGDYVVASLPINVEPVGIAEPAPHQLDAAVANQFEMARAIRDDREAVYQEPPKVGRDDLPDEYGTGSTRLLQQLDHEFRAARYRLGQIVPPGALAALPFVGDSAGAFGTDVRFGNTFRLAVGLAFDPTLLRENDTRDAFFAFGSLIRDHGPKINAWGRTAQVPTADGSSFDERAESDPVREQAVQFEIRAKELLEQCALAKMKRYYSLRRDRTHIDEILQDVHQGGAVVFTDDDFSSDNDEPERDIDTELKKLMPEFWQLNVDVDIRRDDWEDILEFVGWTSGLELIFTNNLVPDWSLGHPYTEAVIRHMVAERWDLVEALVTRLDRVQPNPNYGDPYRAWPLWLELKLGSGTFFVPLEIRRTPQGGVLLHEIRDAGWGSNLQDPIVLDVAARGIDGALASIGTFRPPTFYFGYLPHDRKGYGQARSQEDLAAAMLILTLDEINRLEVAIRDPRAQFYDQFKRQSVFSFAAFTVGEFLFGVSDFYGAINGRNLFTGEKLSPTDRAFAAGMAALSLVDVAVTIGTAGGSKVALATLSNAGRRVRNLAIDNADTLASSATRDARNAMRRANGADSGGIGRAADDLQARGGNPHGTLSGSLGEIYQHVDEAMPVEDVYRYGQGQAAWGEDAIANAGTQPLSSLPGGSPNVGSPARRAQHRLRGTRDPTTGRRTAGKVVEGLGQLDVYEQALFDEGGEALVRRFREIACFPAGTPVLMAGGHWLPIEDLRVGMQVLARDQASPDAAVEARAVVATMQRQVHGLHRLTFRRSGTASGDDDANGMVVATTEEHPFWSLDANGWVSAEDLSVGTVVRGLDEDWEVVAHEVVAEPTVVYNLTVAEAHTYFVGDAGVDGAVWVHNTCRIDEFVAKFGNGSFFSNDLLEAVGRAVGKSADEVTAADKLEAFRMYRQSVRDGVPGLPGTVTPRGTAPNGKAALRENMKDAGTGPLKEEHVAHHLVPVAVGEEHELARVIGWDTDFFGNGKFLPTGDGSLTGLPAHRGPHHPYSRAVNQALTDIQSKHGISLDDLDALADPAVQAKLSAARRDVRRLQHRLRQVLNEGRPPLIIPEGSSDEALTILWRDVIYSGWSP